MQQSDCALIKMDHPLIGTRTNGIIYSPLLLVHIYQAVYFACMLFSIQ